MFEDAGDDLEVELRSQAIAADGGRCHHQQLQEVERTIGHSLEVLPERTMRAGHPDLQQLRQVVLAYAAPEARMTLTHIRDAAFEGACTWLLLNRYGFKDTEITITFEAAASLAYAVLTVRGVNGYGVTISNRLSVGQIGNLPEHKHEFLNELKRLLAMFETVERLPTRLYQQSLGYKTLLDHLLHNGFLIVRGEKQ